MDTFYKFFFEADTPNISNPATLPGGSGGPPPMGGGPLGGMGGPPPMGGPLGGMGENGPVNNTTQKLKAYNVWDVLEEILGKNNFT